MSAAYNQGIMGYKTPNIDRIAKEGRAVHRLVRAAELHRRPRGVHHRPVADSHRPDQGGTARARRKGCREDPTIAEYLLKNHGYMTGQFGKNHLGDRDEHLPTNHGFDEFFGNLYHLNAEEEPENVDYPRRMAGRTFRKKFGPRGVINSWAPTAREGRRHRAAQHESGWRPSTTKSPPAALGFMERAHSGRQAVLPVVELDPHARLYPPEGDEAQRQVTGLGIYPDGMVEHDGHVGQILDKLDDLGIADNTIVMYSTDNGAEDVHLAGRGHDDPFRGEKNTNWEGGFRVP